MATACPPRRSGRRQRAAVWPARGSPAATPSAIWTRTFGTAATSLIGGVPAASIPIMRKEGIHTARRWAAFRPTVTAFTTWRATSGSGAGIASTLILAPRRPIPTGRPVRPSRPERDSRALRGGCYSNVATICRVSFSHRHLAAQWAPRVRLAPSAEVAAAPRGAGGLLVRRRSKEFKVPGSEKPEQQCPTPFPSSHTVAIARSRVDPRIQRRLFSDNQDHISSLLRVLH